MKPRCALQGSLAIIRFRPLAIACTAALLAIAGVENASAQTTPNPPPTAGTGASTSAPQDTGDAETGDTVAESKKSAKKPPKTVTDMSQVVVTGISGSIASSMKTKEDANNIVEAISAEDIGKLPDVSIADSLARVPGLATQRADGHANAISIRGLSPDFAGTTLDGREQATVGENRGVEYDQYPAELINGVTIYKTPDAGLVGQGLSGTVDLHTINPLDLSKRTFVFNLRGAHNSNGSLNPGTGTGTSGHRASFSYVDQFLDHTLGIALGVSVVDQPVQERQYQAWWWSADNGSAGIDQNWGGPHTPGMPDNVVSQEGMQLRAQSQKQKRNGVMAVVEWAPNDVYYSKLDMYYSTFSKRRHTNGAQWSSSPYDHVSYDNVRTSPGQPLPIVTSGTILGVAPILQNEYTREHDKLYSIGWNNKLYVGDWTLMADLSSSSARVKLHDAYLFSGLADGGFTSVDFDTPAAFGYPRFATGVDLADPATMVFTDPGSPWSDPPGYGYNGRDEFDHQDDTIHAFRLQASHPLGWIFSDMDVGLAWSDRTKTKHADVYFAYLNGNGSTRETYQAHLSAPVDPAMLYRPTSLGYGGIDGILNYDVLGALYGGQFYRVRKNGQGDWSRNYTVEEKVPLAYVKLNLDTHLGSLPLRGNLGVQFVRTEQSSRALQTNGDALVGNISDGASYNNVLPSLNLVAEIGESQYLRLGLAKSMARGRIDDEKVATSAHVSQITNGPGAGQILWSGSGGNPQLRPYVAVGTDLSWEKYFGKASYVAAAVFHKNLLNYIYNQTVLDYDFSNYTNDNPTLVPTSDIGSFTTPQNGTGGKMDGLELSGALEGGLLASALEGSGAQANFSLTNSSIPLSSISSVPGGPKTLPGLSRKVANLALFYERYGFSIRVAERYRSSFTGEAVALFDQLGYTKIRANRQTDLQLGYAFTGGSLNGLSLLLQVTNLTNSADSTVQVATLADNTPLTRPLDYDTWGRTILFGINYKL